MMGAKDFLLEQQQTTRSLRLSHDEVRAELVRATIAGGRIAVAAKRLAQVCLPHFEREEQYVFPVLGLLPDLVRGLARPDMARVLPLISNFNAKHDGLDDEHRLIQSAIDVLLEAAHHEQNREVAEFAYNLRLHEKIEDEVIYPTVIMIDNYLRERLSIA